MSRPSSICSENSYIQEFSEVSLTNGEGGRERNDSVRYASSPFPHHPVAGNPGYGYTNEGFQHQDIADNSGYSSLDTTRINQHQNSFSGDPYQSHQSGAAYATDPRRHYQSTMALTSSSEQYRHRSLTPVSGTAGNGYYEQQGGQNAGGGLPPATGAERSSFAGPPSYQDPYARHDMSRSYQNISTMGSGQPPIMTTMPSGYNPSTPGYGPPGAMQQYASRYGPQANAAALQEWLVKYNQWWNYMNHQRIVRERMLDGNKHRLTPHRFPHRHSRVCFGSTNQLLVIHGSNVVIQQLDPGLIDVGETALVSTWPGPLIKGETDKADVLEYIRTQESTLRGQEQQPEEYTKSHQKKQIWLLLSMLVRQNGLISGADLSELLLSNNENEFESGDESTELGKLRRYLMLGQKKTALEFSTKSGLWGHAFALTYITAAPKDGGGALAASAGQMSAMITKFINSTLSRDDPVSILFRCLLQKLENKSNSKLVPTSNLSQFAMLLANDCDVSPAISNSTQSSELLKFIVALRSITPQFLVNLNNLEVDFESDEKGAKFSYSDELVFVNEIWEFSRNINEFIEALVPLKLIFAARLFDYGLVNQASKYCYILRQYYTYYDYYFQGKSIRESSIEWDIVMRVVNDIECRIYGFDVNADSKKEKEVGDDEDSKSQVSDDESDGDDEPDNSEKDTVPESTTQEKSKAAKVVASSSSSVQRAATAPPTSLPTSTIPPAVTTAPQQKSATEQRPPTPKESVSSSSVPVSNRLDKRRLRTTSKENSSILHEAPGPAVLSTPSETAVDSTKSQQSATFPTTINKPSSSESRNQTSSALPAQPNLFVPAPAPPTSEPSAEFNFISTAAPAFPPASNNGSAMKGANDENSMMATGVDDSNNSFSNDGRLSAPMRPEDRMFNSTAMPTAFSSGAGGAFSTPFSPINSPEPESHYQNEINSSFANGSGPVSFGANATHTGVESSNITSASAAVAAAKPTSNTQQKSKGWLSSIMEKVVPAGPRQAILPDDKDRSIYYDENLKRWVNKDDPSAASALEAISKGPPKMPMTSSLPGIISSPPMAAGGPSFSALPPAGQQPLVQGAPPSAGPSFAPPTSFSALPSSPPGAPNALPTAAGANNFSFGSKARKRPQYVDVWQQQQQQKATAS